MKMIPVALPIFNGNEKKYLNECIDTGWISANGRFIEAFQNEFANFCGSKYALACSNGTVTLHLILKAMGIGPGDEVIMPTLTYVATANAAAECGAKPVFIDSDADTWNMDIDKVEDAITNKTKAIIPVHLYGLSCNMDKLNVLSEKYNIPIIEDAAEAHGAMWHDKKVGSMGLAGSFSFFGNKIITSGEGGMIVTDNKDLYERMKLLRSQGVSPNKKYWHICRAYNYRMTNMQAAVGLAQLENINWHISERKRVAGLYKDLFSIKLKELVDIQKVENSDNHVYWMNSIVLSDDVKISRDEVISLLRLKNIETRPLFYPMHIMPPYKDDSINCPIAESLSMRGINLPSHALMNEESITYVVDSIKEILTM